LRKPLDCFASLALTIEPAQVMPIGTPGEPVPPTIGTGVKL
jgi:hypothetical protein